MDVTEEDLRKRYAELDTYELIDLAKLGTLTPLAITVLSDELERRGVNTEHASSVERENKKDNNKVNSDVKTNKLRERYAELGTEELLDLTKHLNLTPLNMTVLSDELEKRGVIIQQAPSVTGSNQTNKANDSKEIVDTVLTQTFNPVIGELANHMVKQSSDGNEAKSTESTPEICVDLYDDACEREAKGETEEARELFTRIIRESPSTPKATKAVLHLERIVKGSSKKIPSVIYAIPILIAYHMQKSHGQAFQNLMYAMLASIGFLILYWSWRAWRNPEIEDPDVKISGVASWLWFIAIINTAIGLMAKLQVWESFAVDWKIQTLIGSGYFVLAAIVTSSRNYFTLWALMAGLIFWAVDTLLIGWEILVSGFQVKTIVYVMFGFHIIILSSMFSGVSGLSGAIKLQQVE